jgi:hypothetical protein
MICYHRRRWHYLRHIVDYSASLRPTARKREKPPRRRFPAYNIQVRMTFVSTAVSISLANSRIIGEVSLDPSRVTSEGGWADPRLVFPLQITLQPQPERAMLVLTEITYSLHSASPASDFNQIGRAVTSNLMYGFTCRTSVGGSSSGTPQIRLPLSQAILTQLEQQRHHHPEHAFSAVLRLQPTIAWIEQTGNVTPDEFKEHPFQQQHIGPFSRLAYFWYPQIGDLEVKISASDWVQHVLPGLGYDQTRLIEIVLHANDGSFPIMNYHDTARRHFDLGNYREAIASCRDIRNAIEQHLGATRTQPVGTVIANQRGFAPDAPQRGILNAVWEAFCVITNEAHHIPGGPRLTEADTRMCLHVTAIILDYLMHLR